MKVVINPKYEYLEDFIKHLPETFENSGEIIYEGRNILKRFEAKGVSFIVKRFKIPHLFNRFVYSYIRKSKAFRSYHYAHRLLDNSINTPEPIAFIEEFNLGLLSYSYYVSKEITDAHEIREFWYDPTLEGRSYILEAFGRFTAEMYKKNILHKDYSSGNILYKTTNDKVIFYLVDINRMRFDEPIKEEEGYKSLRRLWLNDEVFTVIAQSYAFTMGYNITYAVKKILYYKNAFMGDYKNLSI